jgi:hypothetical protein
LKPAHEFVERRGDLAQLLSGGIRRDATRLDWLRDP